jgi:hypothetical protein
VRLRKRTHLIETAAHLTLEDAQYPVPGERSDRPITTERDIIERARAGLKYGERVSAARVPQAEGAIRAGAEHPGAAVDRDRGVNLIEMAPQYHLWAAPGTPDPDGTIGAGGHDPPVAAVIDRVHVTVVSCEHPLGAGRTVETPEEELAGRTGGNNAPAVGTRSDVPDILRSAGQDDLAPGTQIA